MNLWQMHAGETAQTRRQQAFDILWCKLIHNGGAHYAVVDTARDDAILSFVRNRGDEAVCLYSGDARIRLANYAPYIFRLDPNCAATREFLAKGWGQSWYILIGSPRPIADIAWQLRKALIVRTDEGKDFYFRLYDPRVLRGYLRRQYPTIKPSRACTSTARLGSVCIKSALLNPFHFSAGVRPSRF